MGHDKGKWGKARGDKPTDDASGNQAAHARPPGATRQSAGRLTWFEMLFGWVLSLMFVAIVARLVEKG